MLDETDFAPLETALRGHLIRRGDADYDDARTIYNAMIDKSPRLIARCANVADVIAAVKFGREAGLSTAIRGGGHNGPGLAMAEDGLVIDLSAMKGLRVEAQARRVRVEPGCTWADVDHATHAFRLATVSGIVSTTGVGGLTLGGGHGYLTRKHGLTIDNLISADVVLADGSLVTASADDHPDLFWALRGGGSNFGIVTSFEFRLHAVDTVIGGPMFWPIADLDKTLRWYRDWLPNASQDVYAFYATHEVPPAAPFPEGHWGRKVCGLVWCCTGDRAQAEAALAEARAVAEPIIELVGEMPYPALQSLFDGLYAPGLQWYWRGGIVSDIPDAAVDIHRRFGEVPTTYSTMHLYPVNGAAADTTSEAAWAHRDANWSMVVAGVAPDAAQVETAADWARTYESALRPHTKGAAYVNFMMEEGAERVAATYGDNLARLRRVKARYDPDNFFRANQNITPEAG